MNKFHNLNVWKKSLRLIENTYKFADLLPYTERRNLQDQLKRAVVSIGLNIAEGSNSENDREFMRFLRIAKNSASEVLAIFIISENLYNLQSEELKKDTEEIIKMINGLNKYLKKSMSIVYRLSTIV